MSFDDKALIALMRQVADGNVEAFQSLYRTTSPYLYALLMRMLQSPDQADDALQDCYLKVWRGGTRYTADRGAVMAWLTTLARHCAIDRLRRQRLRWTTEVEVEDRQLAEMADESCGIEAQVAEWQAMAQVRRSMRTLSAGERNSIGLAYFEGLSAAEIADRLDIPLGTAKSWLRRGLHKLQKATPGAAAPEESAGARETPRRPARAPQCLAA